MEKVVVGMKEEEGEGGDARRGSRVERELGKLSIPQLLKFRSSTQKFGSHPGRYDTPNSAIGAQTSALKTQPSTTTSKILAFTDEALARLRCYKLLSLELQSKRLQSYQLVLKLEDLIS